MNSSHVWCFQAFLNISPKGSQAVARSYGRPGDLQGAFRVSEGARTGPFWCQKSSEKSVLNSTYFGPLFSTFQRPFRARSGAEIRRNTDLAKIMYFHHVHPNMPKNGRQFSQEKSKRYEMVDAAATTSL